MPSFPQAGLDARVADANTKAGAIDFNSVPGRTAYLDGYADGLLAGIPIDNTGGTYNAMAALTRSQFVTAANAKAAYDDAFATDAAADTAAATANTARGTTITADSTAITGFLQ